MLLLLTVSGLATAQITLDGTVGPAKQLTGPNYTIPAADGRQVGANLFHSFGEFNIQTNESATFTGPQGIDNVIGRVTGGNMSTIDGRLSCDIPDANLYLLNPSGVMFGPNATLDVHGSFAVSTADYIKLADGGRFDAHAPSSSVLTAAPPAAFGFLASQPAPIAVNQAALQVPARQTLTVAGGDISISGGTLAAPGGRINMAGLASRGEVTPKAQNAAADVAITTGTAGGALTLSQGAHVTTDGPGGGTIVIRGGKFELQDASTVTAVTQESVDGGGIDAVVDSLKLTGGSALGSGTLGAGKGGTLSVVARGDVTIAGEDQDGYDSGLFSTAEGQGDGGTVTVQAGSLSLTAGGTVGSTTFGPGRGGDVTVTADSIAISGEDSTANDSSILADVHGMGDGGTVTVHADSLSLGAGGRIVSQSCGPGRAGDVTVTASGALSISGEDMYGLDSGIFSAATDENYGAGDAGSIVVQADTLSLTAGGTVISLTGGPGRGGNVMVTANSIAISGEDSRASLSSISSKAQGTGNEAGDGGSVVVQAGTLSLTAGGQVESVSFGPGHGGDVMVTASDSIAISGTDAEGGSSGIDAVAQGDGATAGDGGSVLVSAPVITVTDGGAIFTGSSELTGVSNAGDVGVNAGALRLSAGGAVFSATSGRGQGGNVTVAADSIEISGEDSRGFDSSIGTTAQGTGPDFQGTGGGPAGSVVVQTGTLSLTAGGQVKSISFTPGDGGNVTVMARDSIFISGQDAEGTASGVFANAQGARANAGDAGNVLVSAPMITVTDGGAIAAESNEATGAGAAGDVTVNAGTLSLTAGGEVDSNTSGLGRGGNVTVTADSLEISGEDSAGRDSAIAADTNGEGGNAGDAGTVMVQAGSLRLTAGGQVSSISFGPGHGGNVTVTVSGALSIAGEDSSGSSSGIFTNAQGEGDGAGDGGAIVVEAGSLSLTAGGEVSSSTMGPGHGGTVMVTADSIEISGENSRGFDSAIGADAQGKGDGAGDGGSVVVQAGTLDLTAGGAVSSTSFGSGHGGNVTVTASDSIAISGSDAEGNGGGIFANAQGTGGTAGDGGSVLVSAPVITITDGGAIVAESTEPTGAGDAGEITINAGSLGLASGGSIQTTTFGPGHGGDIMVTGSEISATTGALIGTGSDGTGDAGNITVTATDKLEIQDAAIAAEATQAFGGSIHIEAPTLRLYHAAITTSVGAGSGDGGNITMQTDQAVMDRSRVTAKADVGNGGNITIDSNAFIASPDTVVNASSNKGISGTVAINSPETNIAGAIAVLPQSFLHADALLGQRCAARRGGHASTFVVAGREALPTAPDGLLPSPENPSDKCP